MLGGDNDCGRFQKALLLKSIHHLADRGIGVLITDHKARELLAIVDRAYVIESGRVLAEGDVEQIVADQDVRRVYLGEEFRL